MERLEIEANVISQDEIAFAILYILYGSAVMSCPSVVTTFSRNTESAMETCYGITRGILQYCHEFENASGGIETL